MHRDVLRPGKNKMIETDAKNESEQGGRHIRVCEEKAIRARRSPDCKMLFRRIENSQPQFSRGASCDLIDRERGY